MEIAYQVTGVTALPAAGPGGTGGPAYQVTAETDNGWVIPVYLTRAEMDTDGAADNLIQAMIRATHQALIRAGKPVPATRKDQASDHTQPPARPPGRGCLPGNHPGSASPRNRDQPR